MKIRKKTSFMLLAASTAAVVGVAAVSFAAWQGSNGGTLTANAATGAVEVLGFNTTPTYTVSPLVPYDQGSVEGCVNVYDLEIPTVDYNVDYTISVKYSAATDVTLNLQYQYNTTATVPVNKDNYVASEWTDLTKDYAKIDEGTVDAVDTPVNSQTTKYLHVILVSNKNEDMKKDFTITITLEKATQSQG